MLCSALPDLYYTGQRAEQPSTSAVCWVGNEVHRWHPQASSDCGRVSSTRCDVCEQDPSIVDPAAWYDDDVSSDLDSTTCGDNCDGTAAGNQHADLLQTAHFTSTACWADSSGNTDIGTTTDSSVVTTCDGDGSSRDRRSTNGADGRRRHRHLR